MEALSDIEEAAEVFRSCRWLRCDVEVTKHLALARRQEDGQIHLRAHNATTASEMIREGDPVAISEVAKQLGLTITEFASELGISRAWASQVCSGRRRPSKALWMAINALRPAHKNNTDRSIHAPPPG